MCFGSHPVHVAVFTSLSSPFTPYMDKKKAAHSIAIIASPCISHLLYQSLTRRICRPSFPAPTALPSSHLFRDIFPSFYFTLHLRFKPVFFSPTGDLNHEPLAPVDRRDGGMKGWRRVRRDQTFISGSRQPKPSGYCVCKSPRGAALGNITMLPLQKNQPAIKGPLTDRSIGTNLTRPDRNRRHCAWLWRLIGLKEELGRAYVRPIDGFLRSQRLWL